MAKKPSMGSLFDGSGGFPYVAKMCGIEPKWASEIEIYPIRVTTKRFPEMKHLGDISKINGGEIEPVDLITFGSPCQSLSVAGKREGIKHTGLGDEETTESGLFMDAIRVIREMRTATGGEYPKYIIWENVCFCAGTVITTQGGYRDIEDVKQGQFVKTHEGRYREVKEVYKTEGKETLTLKVHGAEKLRVTPNHPFYARREKFSETEWIAAEELTADSYVGFKVDTGKNSIGISTAYSFGEQVLDPNYGIPQWAFFLKRSEQKALVEGFLSSREISTHDRYWWLNNLSRRFAHGFARMMRNVYHTGVEILKCCGDYVIIYNAESKDYYYDYGYMWQRVKGISKGKIETVYNLSVEGDNSYEANGISVHNCGAFSSTGGEDFRTVLQEIERIAAGKEVYVPRPPESWTLAGSVLGHNYSIAWRTFDAQYWGVAQRRRRIYLVADFTGRGAEKILFEREGLQRNFKTGAYKEKGTPRDVGKGINTADKKRCIAFEPGILKRKGGHYTEDKANTLRAQMGDNQLAVAIENHPAGSYAKISKDNVCQTLTARMGTGGGNVPLVLTSEKTICINGEVASKGEKAYANGMGWSDDISYTLTTKDRHAVCYFENDYSNYKESEVGGTLKASGGALAGGSETIVCDFREEPQYIVRRLTPLECLRLQGLPDYWETGLETENPTEEEIEFWRKAFKTHREITGGVKDKTDNQIIEWLKNPYSESASYKMIGNGIAIPTALYVVEGIAEAMKKK